MDEAIAWRAGIRHFETGLSHNQAMGALPWLAHTQHDYAKMLLARGKTADCDRAQQLLACAAEHYQTLGMTQWLGRATQLMAKG